MAVTSNKWCTRYYLFSVFFVVVTPPGILMVTLLFSGDQKFWMETNFTSLTLSGNAGRFKSPRTFMQHLQLRAELKLLCFRSDEVDILGAEPHMPEMGMRA